MWPVGVVVLDVFGDQAFELLLVPDDGAVEELSADGADPSFGECVGYGCADRGLEDLEAFCSEDLVEGVDELASPIANEGTRIGEPVGVAEEELAGCLCGPGAGRVSGGTDVEDLARGYVDEEEDVVAAEQGGVDGEEVAGHRGLGVKELRPGDVRAFRGRVDAAGFEDLPRGRGGDAVAEACEFAVDASVAPGRVLGGEADDESSEFDRCWWSSWSSVGLGLVASHSAPVPSEEGVGGDEPAGSTRPGECGCDGAEQDAVVVGDLGSADLATQDGELMAEDDDLEVFGAAGAKGETGERSDESVDDARHR